MYPASPPLLKTTTFLSAFLLFLAEPLTAKGLLPYYGGTAEVWATCLVVFNVLMLAGYAYADRLIHRGTPAVRVVLHRGLVLVGALSIGVGMWVPATPLFPASPALSLMLIISTKIGLPFLVLASTSPLLQAWSARGSMKTYQLYGMSNAGSLLGLLAFPLVLEPLLPGQIIFRGWIFGFALYGVLMWRLARHATQGPEPALENPVTPSKILRFSWLWHSVLGVLILLISTDYMTQSLPALPFLWVLPLSAYLVAFTIAFSQQRALSQIGLGWLTTAGVVAISVAAFAGFVRHLPGEFADVWQFPLQPQIWSFSHEWNYVGALGLVLVFGAGTFIVSYFYAERLVATKPPPAQLTCFYVTIAAGGALGAFLMVFAVPRLFPYHEELPLILAVTLVACAVPRSLALRAVVIGGLTFLALATAHQEICYRLHTAFIARSFYGTVRVEDRKSDGQVVARILYNGEAGHGEESFGVNAQLPEFYDEKTGVGRLLASLESPARVGVVGLGAGTLAAFSHLGDTYRFYEIDPNVKAAALGYFDFLQHAAGHVDLIIGDGRIALSRETPQLFDLLVLDAFSAGNIPVHLLTREAFGVYCRHLSPKGLLLYHVESQELNLVPVIAELAQSAGLAAVYLPGESHWVLVGPHSLVKPWLQRFPRSTLLQSEPNFTIWTDDHVNLLEVWNPVRRWLGRPTYE